MVFLNSIIRAIAYGRETSIVPAQAGSQVSEFVSFITESCAWKCLDSCGIRNDEAMISYAIALVSGWYSQHALVLD